MSHSPSKYSWTVSQGVRSTLGRELRKIEKAAGPNGRTCTRLECRALIAEELAARPEWSLTTKFEDPTDRAVYLTDFYKMTRKAAGESDQYSSNNDISISVSIHEYMPESEYMRRWRQGSAAATRTRIGISAGEFEDYRSYRSDHDEFSEYVNLTCILLCLDKAVSIADRIPQMIEHQEQLEMNAKTKEVKRKKIHEIREENVMTVLERICSGLKTPYALVKLSTRVDLKIQLPNNTHLKIEIPLAKYQEILPALEEIIQSYMSVIAHSQAKVLILNDDTKTRWRVNEKQ
ncbi:MAG: hypothetical protein LBL26_04995 [Peptococcaceae bacterium]|jgi:hypothetical protein|nr:hypothetical protein [Peptococcaceae bacterium]